LDGSSRRLLAVRSAACLSAHDVPVAGGEAGDFGPDILANLLCSSFICEPRLGGAGGGKTDLEAEFCRGGTGGDGFARGGTGGEAVRPIPKPDTETPAWPRRPRAPWFSTPCSGLASCVASLYVGGGAGANSSGFEFWRGGSGGRGGRLGFGLAAPAVGGVAAPGLNAGGLGRCAVLKPVVSGRYGPGAGLFASSSSLLLASSRSCSLCFADPAGADDGPDGADAAEPPL